MNNDNPKHNRVDVYDEFDDIYDPQYALSVLNLKASYHVDVDNNNTGVTDVNVINNTIIVIPKLDLSDCVYTKITYKSPSGDIRSYKLSGPNDYNGYEVGYAYLSFKEKYYNEVPHNLTPSPLFCFDLSDRFINDAIKTKGIHQFLFKTNLKNNKNHLTKPVLLKFTITIE